MQRDIATRAYALAGGKPKLNVAGKPMLRALGLFDPFERALVKMQCLMTEQGILELDDCAPRTLIGPISKPSYDEASRLSFATAQRAMTTEADPLPAHGPRKAEPVRYEAKMFPGGK